MRPGKIQPIYIAFLIPAVVIVAAVIFLIARKTLGARHDAFPVAAYFTAPDNFRGNRYTLDAQVVQRLDSDEGFGKILVFKPVDGAQRVSVFVAEKLFTGNLELGQRFHLNIYINDHGDIIAEDIEKY